MSFADIISMWPSMADLARDIRASHGAVRVMKVRGRIPDEYWQDLVAGASRRGIDGVTLERLAGLAAEKRRPSPSEAAE
ncbi:hypothetical protein [Nitrospirillum sp. BR 11163]|uniref:hypothetical protein n=1 Tax=Nitrospirillum sp. BR 11163 TaxID=3104323 RepID=UPI002AFF32A2|nr:hypothetical protein [Nitrospirillum sp. BR 11163]MEA1674077.1 hypothetical protein [Nitrospirillum sp. BR 11163]